MLLETNRMLSREITRIKETIRAATIIAEIKELVEAEP
jgi:hypothetical protein